MSHTVITENARDCAAAYDAYATSARAGEGETAERAASREFKESLKRANEAVTPIVTDLFDSENVQYVAAGFETCTGELAVRVELTAPLADAALPSRASIYGAGFSRMELDENLRGLTVVYVYASAA